MDFNDLCNAVYVETNRPDLVAETQQAVLASTQMLHITEFFQRDIKTALIRFDTRDCVQQIDTSCIPRYRKLAYLRSNPADWHDDQCAGLPNTRPLCGIDPPWPWDWNLFPFYQPITADDILDSYGAQRIDTVYQAGTVLVARRAWAVRSALIGWYEFPNLDIPNNGAQYSSWIAELYPYAIIYYAAAQVFRKKGQADVASAYDSPAPANNPDGGGMATQQKRILLMNEITVEGL